MISFVMLTKNSERTLKQALESTKGIGSVTLIDTGSTDATLEIARSFPHVTVYERSFTSFGPLRNEGASLAPTDWIFALDSDEELSPPLIDYLKTWTPQAQTIYRVSSANFYRGKRIRYSGWSPDYKLRFYNKQETQFSDRKVHEDLEVKTLKIETLPAPLYHYSYASASELIDKMQRYSDLFAEEYAGRKKSSHAKAVLRGSFAFFKTYILKCGFLDGFEGLLIANYNAQTTYFKYIKLSEKEG